MLDDFLAATTHNFGGEIATFLVNFFDEYPFLKDSELVLTGSGSAAAYVAQAARAIDEHNHKDSTSVNLNLKSVILNEPHLTSDQPEQDQNSKARSSLAHMVHSQLHGEKIQGLWKLCEE